MFLSLIIMILIWYRADVLICGVGGELEEKDGEEKQKIKQLYT